MLDEKEYREFLRKMPKTRFEDLPQDAKDEILAHIKEGEERRKRKCENSLSAEKVVDDDGLGQK